MATNYLHDFTKVLDGAIEKYDGISTAITLKDPSEFKEQENYKEKVLQFRKTIRITRVRTITDIMNILDGFLNEETLTLYSIEKAFDFVKEYEGSKDIIKSIMNKFDKNLRMSINKDILSQFGITAKVQRSSHWLGESLKGLVIEDKRKVEQNPLKRQVHSKSPEWTVEIVIPLPAINVTNQSREINVSLPLHDSNQIRIHVRYAFKPLTEFFINNIKKIGEYKKDIKLFVTDLMNHVERQVSFNTHVNKSYIDHTNLGHPYINTNGNWCPGDFTPALDKAYRTMDITLLATTIHTWMSNYTIGVTNPHNQIESLYRWLPLDLGEGVEQMPFRQNMGRHCYDSHNSTDICIARKCAFIERCDSFANAPESPTESSTAAVLASTATVSVSSSDSTSSSTTGTLTVNGRMSVPSVDGLRENLLVANNMGLEDTRAEFGSRIFEIASLPIEQKSSAIEFLKNMNDLKSHQEDETLPDQFFESIRNDINEHRTFVNWEWDELLPIINHVFSIFGYEEGNTSTRIG